MTGRLTDVMNLSIEACQTLHKLSKSMDSFVNENESAQKIPTTLEKLPGIQSSTLIMLITVIIEMYGKRSNKDNID